MLTRCLEFRGAKEEEAATKTPASIGSLEDVLGFVLVTEVMTYFHSLSVACFRSVRDSWLLALKAARQELHLA